MKTSKYYLFGSLIAVSLAGGAYFLYKKIASSKPKPPKVNLSEEYLTARVKECAEKLGISVDTITNKLPHILKKIDPKVEEKSLADFIDHTALKSNVTEKAVAQLCQEAIDNKFYAICVNGSRVQYASHYLKGSGVKVAAVIGFPLGAMSTEAKVAEAKDVVSKGADEVDMVMNVGLFLDGDYKAVYNDIKAVVDACPKTVVKVILETSLLNYDQIFDASVIAVMAGAHFIKTSTGFVGQGATKEGVTIMKQVAGEVAKVKASGGIRTKSAAQEYIKLGISRIGTSSGVQIVSGK
jgi:deoxyribose-phosphate aldolase